MRKFHIVADDHRVHEEAPMLPKRSTTGSAGYDFYLPEDILIFRNESILIWTDVKAEMYPREFLQMHIRSSYGIKKNLMLSNIVGIIDKDYYNNKSNDGNIGICLHNYGNDNIELKKGDAYCQGIFLEYSITDDDSTYQEREGGIGSTGGLNCV